MNVPYKTVSSLQLYPNNADVATIKLEGYAYLLAYSTMNFPTRTYISTLHSI